MIKKVKTKSSTPGRSSVQGSKIEKGNILDIFSGSDEDSTENSKAFDNPQESRGHDSSEGARTPDLNTPEPGDPGRAGTNFESPNFKINTKNLTSKPESMIGMKETGLSDRAKTPLSTVETRNGKVPGLAETNMSKPVLEKYPAANDIARSNASYPSDFASQLMPIKSGLNADSLDQRSEVKNQVYQKVTEVPFQMLDDKRIELKTKAEEKVSEYTNPQIQADYFTSKGKEALTPDFLKQEMSPSNVFNEYSSTTGEYGKGQFPETQKASSTITDKSAEAGNVSSPQRGADALNNTQGRGNFKGEQPQTPAINIDQSGVDKVKSNDSSGMLSQGSQSRSLSSEAKSFFFSNFGPISPTISDTISGSSSTTDSAASTVTSNMNI